jgi:hypothetical protein
MRKKRLELINEIDFYDSDSEDLHEQDDQSFALSTPKYNLVKK